MRCALLIASALLAACAAAQAAPAKLLRFPDIWHDRIVFSYAGDLWTVAAAGGTATRLTAHQGLELFGKFSPDGRQIAFTGQYGGDEQVYVMPAGGGAPRQLTFYPAKGPLADRWGYDNQVYGWTPDGKSILFRSARDAFILTGSRLYTVPVEGGAAVPLPMPVSGAGHYSPDGTRMVYSPLWRDFRSEKRYQGGWANDLYIFDLGHPSLVQVTDDPRTDRDPMWIGDAVYFNSDRSGVFNLYRYDLATRQTRALTHYRDWDVRWPSADADGHIVYELDGELHVFDTRGESDRAVPIEVPADDTSRRPQAVDAADDIESIAISPGGERIAVVARGDVFDVPAGHGVTRNLTHSSDAHDREAGWSADGRRLVYVSDRSGEDEIYVQDQDGAAAAQALTTGSAARYFAPVMSPDQKRIAFADNAGRLFSVEIANRRRVLVARDPADIAREYRWSPDGRFLAYTLNEPSGYSGVYVWAVADETSRRVTPELFRAHTPAWAPDGQLLYFLSERDYPALISTVEFDFATDRQTGIFAIALRKGSKNPFGVQDEEPGDNKAKDKDTDKSPPTVQIDFDGIIQRAIRVPVPADDLANLHVGTDNLLYQRTVPPFYPPDPEPKSTVMSFSIKDRQAKPVAEAVSAWSATADGRHVLAKFGAKELKLFEVGRGEDGAGEDARGGDAHGDGKAVSLAGLETTRIPAAEWREIFAEVWRRYRDYFYVANMHGYDWVKLRQKYQPLLDSVGHRADLNYVIAEMIAELTVQHAYIQGGDLGLPKRPFVALPGARFELDAKSGRYRIARLFAGQNEEERYRSPLTEVGVDVHVGDYVLAINGRELDAAHDPYELLEAPAGQPAEWRVAASADGKSARTIRYQPLASEANLLYLDWTADKRARVDALSRGRVGYIHIPDMGEDGFYEFIKWWYPQVRKEALLVDVRDNGGGEISQMLIERLSRRLLSLDYARNYGAPMTYPEAVQLGPQAALINEDTASDGDIFSYMFKQQNLGPLIGKRTWGGVVGINELGPLLDGGTVYVPQVATASAAGQWIIEGHGVDPDIRVEQDPVAVLAGRDPQLERGVAELLKRLPAAPAGLPPPPAPPVKTPAP
ncbi:MAG: S41 family peptidase [Steroidobacteraceae bacterium]|jgi:tricorn protease